MKKNHALICSVALLALTSAAPAFAEETLQKQATEVLKKTNGRDRFFTVTSENDLYAPGGGDSNYTNGVQLTYYDMGAEVPDFFYAIDKLVPTFSINDTTSISYSVGHNIFTPKDITSSVQNPNDRPWAAYLYTSAALTSITADHIDSLEATLGVVGPLAMGEPIQKFWHKNVSDSPRPEGWHNQLDTEPGVTLSWERSFPDRVNFETLGWTASAAPHIGATLGNIYTYANTGFSFRLSPYSGRWQDNPVRVRPALSGTGAFVIPDNTFSWYFFGGVDGRAVARNIFLDGNTFGDSFDVDKKTFVADANLGIAAAYGPARISYTMVYRTKEFDTAPENGDLFGTISVGYRF